MRGPRTAELSGSAHPRSDSLSLQSVHFRFDRTGGSRVFILEFSTRTTPPRNIDVRHPNIGVALDGQFSGAKGRALLLPRAFVKPPMA